MNPGLLTALDTATAALTLSAGIVIFTEETQRRLCVTMNRKAAAAGGIEAIAQRAIDTGDHDAALDLIVNLAAELREGLLLVSNIAGQLKAVKAAKAA
jgi:hypothetical protein